MVFTRDERTPRSYEEDVDWVLQAPGRLLSLEEVTAQVNALRASRTAQVDTVPPADPPLASTCDF